MSSLFPKVMSLIGDAFPDAAVIWTKRGVYNVFQRCSNREVLASDVYSCKAESTTDDRFLLFILIQTLSVFDAQCSGQEKDGHFLRRILLMIRIVIRFRFRFRFDLNHDVGCFCRDGEPFRVYRTSLLAARCPYIGPLHFFYSGLSCVRCGLERYVVCISCSAMIGW